MSPIKSERQRRWMWKNKPELAQKWADEGKMTVPKKRKPTKRKKK